MECPSCKEGHFVTKMEIDADCCWYCGGKINKEKIMEPKLINCNENCPGNIGPFVINVDTSELVAALSQADPATFAAHWPEPKELFEVQNVPGGLKLVPSERLRQYVQPLAANDYHPNLDGPAEPVGLSMDGAE